MFSRKAKVENEILIGNLVELLPKRLYFASLTDDVGEHTSGRSVFVKFGEKYHYEPFYKDFGPWNLSVLYRLCIHINDHLEREERRGREIIMYCVDNGTIEFDELRVNCAYMLGAYLIIYHGLSADAAFLRINVAQPPKFIGFRDAAMGESTYSLHVHDVLRGVEKALQHGWLDFTDFDYQEYEYYEKVENGDFNWIIPGKILSFCGPHNENKLVEGYPHHAPEVYFDYFNERKISTIVRLNRKLYDARRFTNAGFDHVDLFFVDGSTPTDEIVMKFIQVVDQAKGGVAVHCKAGLGRTGTLIACWMMKEYGLSAAECIAWLRICRPGSVIGPQQQWLIDKQRFCWSLSSHNGIHLAKRSNRRNVGSLASKVDDMTLTTKNRQTKTKENSRTRPAILFRRSERLIPPPSQNIPADSNGNPLATVTIDETAVDEHGKSQGDRLLELKAKKQHEKKVTSDVELAEDALASRFFRGQQMVLPSQAYLNRNREAIPSKGASSRTSPKTSPTNGRISTSLFPSIAARRSEATRFSSPTTPIKPMSPSVTTRSRQAEGATPISRCILSASKSRPTHVVSTSVLRKIQLSRPRPYPPQGVRVELSANANIYELRPRAVREQPTLPGATLPPNTEALIGRRRKKTFSA